MPWELSRWLKLHRIFYHLTHYWQYMDESRTAVMVDEPLSSTAQCHEITKTKTILTSVLCMQCFGHNWSPNKSINYHSSAFFPLRFTLFWTRNNFWLTVLVDFSAHVSKHNHKQNKVKTALPFLLTIFVLIEASITLRYTVLWLMSLNALIHYLNVLLVCHDQVVISIGP